LVVTGFESRTQAAVGLRLLTVQIAVWEKKASERVFGHQSVKTQLPIPQNDDRA